MSEYIPGRGDLIVLTFDPQSGHEQMGRRPALVLSKYLFNRKTGLAIVCPVTRTDRDFPFHVPVPGGSRVSGFIMVEQLKAIDYRSRKARKLETAPEELLSEVLAILDACLY
jgi:mRNA interferase MazF